MENIMGRYRNITILGAVIILQLLGLAVQVKRKAQNQSTRLIRVWAVGAVTPLERAMVGLQNGATGIWRNYFYLRGVRQQNRELQDQIEKLRLQQVRLSQDAEQARRLQALLGFKEQFIDKTVAAQVIGSSGSEQSRVVYLDKGSADGIAQDMAVISPDGVVGKVAQTFRHTSQVLLINDQNSGVGTILEQSRLQGVLKGRATGEVVLDKIMAEEEVRVGERVLTSGGDQIFPKGLPVGVVSKVARGAEFLVVTVRPAAALNHLEEVLVITKKEEREPGLSPASPVRAADILAERLPSVPDQPKQSAEGTEKASSGTTNAQAKPAGTATTALPKSQASSASQTDVVVKKSPGLAPNTVPTRTATEAADQPAGRTAPTTPSGAAARQPKAETGAATQSGTLKPTGVPAQSTTSGTSNNASTSKPAINTTQPPKQPKPAEGTGAKPVANTTQPPSQPATGDTPQ